MNLTCVRDLKILFILKLLGNQTHYSVKLFKLKLHIHAYDWESITMDTENIKQTSIETVKNVVWVMFVMYVQCFCCQFGAI